MLSWSKKKEFYWLYFFFFLQKIDLWPSMKALRNLKKIWMQVCYLGCIFFHGKYHQENTQINYTRSHQRGPWEHKFCFKTFVSLSQENCFRAKLNLSPTLSLSKEHSLILCYRSCDFYFKAQNNFDKEEKIWILKGQNN